MCRENDADFPLFFEDFRHYNLKSKKTSITKFAMMRIVTMDNSPFLPFSAALANF